MPDEKAIDERALDSISVAPDVDEGDVQRDVSDPRQNAGQDKSIAKRLAKNPDSQDAQLDNALDESMDASDPPSNTQPGSSSEPAPSSGFSEEAERQQDS